MPMVTRTTRVTTTGVAVHTISFRGIAGAIFMLIMLALVLYVIGFSTTAWTVYGDLTSSHDQHGLWQSCRCGTRGKEDWLTATQAMITIGLIGLLIAMILISIYMCVHTVSKNQTILALVIVCFLSVLFMLVGFLIYGIKQDDLSWSFAVTVIASILTLIAGILSIVQMRSAGLA